MTWTLGVDLGWIIGSVAVAFLGMIGAVLIGLLKFLFIDRRKAGVDELQVAWEQARKAQQELVVCAEDRRRVWELYMTLLEKTVQGVNKNEEL